MTTEILEDTSISMEGKDNFGEQMKKEKVFEELKRIDEVREIMHGRYPKYGILRDFIDHLASTEKVFTLAGIKNFGGNEVMDMFIDSETEVMAKETGIAKDVFDRIKEVFMRTYEAVGDISSVADDLEVKYNDEKSREFIQYLEKELIMILDISEKNEDVDFDIDKEKEETIKRLIIEMSQNDKVEMERLRDLYEEFKQELNEELSRD